MTVRTVGLAMFGAILGLVSVLPAAAATTTSIDLSARSVTPNVTVAHVGDRVVFAALAEDLGPDPVVNDSLDVHYLGAVGLRVVREHCSDGISPDTPYCEFGAEPVGRFVEVRVVARVTPAAADAGLIRLRFCTSNESTSAIDPDPSNDCRGARVPVLA